MKIVISRLLCAVIMLVVIVIIYLALQALGKKRVNLFNNCLICWIAAFIIGILLFILGANFILG